MTPLERLTITLQHREPDRIPLFLTLTMHGAKELGLSIQEYFAKAENVAEGQLRLQNKYGNDFLYTFFYAAIEMEAWGGETIYIDNGPPNSGEPILKNKSDIRFLTPPRVNDCPSLLKVLKTNELLKARVGTDTPIIGVIISPFSLPVLQLGFAAYIELHCCPVRSTA